MFHFVSGTGSARGRGAIPHSTEPAYRRAQRAYRCVGAVGIPKDLVVLTREEFERERQARVVTSLARRARDRGKVLYERWVDGGGRSCWSYVSPLNPHLSPGGGLPRS